MTLAISALKNIFTLYTKTQVNHLKYPRCTTPNVDIFLLKEVAYVDEWNPIENQRV